MRRNPLVFAAAALLAAGLIVGSIEFPRALEPTRSDRDQIVLNTVADRGTGPAPNDWYSTQPATPARQRNGALILTAGATGNIVVSRILPVFPEACYTVTAALDVARGRVAIAVYDEELTHVISYRLSTGAETLLRFATPPGVRRVSLALVGRVGTRAALRSGKLTRTGSARDCARNHPGTDIGAVLDAKR